MRKTDESFSEKLKTQSVKILMKKKVFQKSRVSGRYLTAADGTHAVTVNEGHCEHCLNRTSAESGKTTYFHNVVGAEPVTENGFSISPATERVENPEGKYDKQDCGLKAFGRLAEKLKKDGSLVFCGVVICHISPRHPNKEYPSISINIR